MKNILTTLGVVLGMLGFMVMAGSAGDCDGKCMEHANDIPTMLMSIGIGLSGLLGGTLLIVVAQRDL